MVGKSKHMRKISLTKNQQGLVSFVVTIIIMLILSLIVMGFARLSQREQRQSLDRQLSTQAFYAAEAGINDAIQELKNPASPYRTAKKDTCDWPNDEYANELNPSGPITYSCLLIDPTPTEYKFDAVDQSSSEIVQIESSTGVNIETINFYWQDKDGKTGLAACQDLTSTGIPAGWPAGCDTGMLRIDLVPYGTGSSPTRQTLVASQLSAFIFPSSSGSDIIYSAAPEANQGILAKGTCDSANTPKYCQLSITNLNSNRYFLRMKGIYGTSSVSITSEGPDGNLIEMSGYQALIDSTGKANDVLRRVQVSVPYGNLTGPFPEFVAQSAESLCKRFTVADTIGLTLPPAAPGNECDPRQN